MRARLRSQASASGPLSPRWARCPWRVRAFTRTASPRVDPEEAHGGEQKGLHDLPGLGEAGKLAGGVMQGLQMKHPPVEVCLRPGGTLNGLP